MTEPLQSTRLTRVAIAAAVAFSACVALYQVRTYDTLFHLAVGRYILERGAVPTADVFSFSFPGAPWINHSWGFDVLVAKLHALGGFAAISLHQALMAALLAAIALGSLARRTQLVPHAAWLCAVPMLAFREVLEARAHVMGFALLAGSLALLLDAFRAPRPRALLVLPLLYAGWAVLHGSHIVLLVLTAAALATAAAHRMRPLALALGTALLAMLLINLALAPVSIAQGREHIASGFLEQSVSEWYPVTLQDLVSYWPARVYLAALLLTAIGIALAHGRAAASWGEDLADLHARTPSGRYRLLTLALLFALSLTSRRMLPLFLFGAAPAFLPYAALAVQRAARGAAAAVLAIAFAGLVALLVLLPSEFHFGAGLDGARFPIAAVQALKERRLERPYNAYNYGGYLMFEGVPVLVDGRAITVYPAEFLTAQQRAYEQPELFEQLAARFRVDGVLMPVTSARTAQLRAYLDTSPRWRAIHRDAVAVLYLPATPPARN